MDDMVGGVDYPAHSMLSEYGSSIPNKSADTTSVGFAQSDRVIQTYPGFGVHFSSLF
jgi:hypothetical protein